MVKINYVRKMLLFICLSNKVKNNVEKCRIRMANVLNLHSLRRNDKLF